MKKEINRKNIREDLLDAIMKITNWTADLKLSVIKEIYPKRK